MLQAHKGKVVRQDMICGCILSGDVVSTEMSLYLMVALGYKQSMLTYGAKVLWFSKYTSLQLLNFT